MCKKNSKKWKCCWRWPCYQLKSYANNASFKKKNIKFYETGLKHGTITAIINDYKFEITSLRKDLNNIMKTIGSDVPLGMNLKNTILSKTGKLTVKEKKLGLYALIVKPNFGCSTKVIYSKTKEQTKPKYNNPKVSLFSINNIINSNNDLEKAAFKLNPKLKNLKLFLSSLPNTMCVRMTGSGSCIVAYYQSEKKALKGLGLLKKKYKNYWCIVSKTV